jgi:hypothetical protein
MSSESFVSSTSTSVPNLIGAVISKNNREIQTKLHGLVDNMSSRLKSELDVVLKNLLDISDEYDETSRIILTLPCVKRAISTTPPCQTHYSDALSSLKEYVGEDEVESPTVLLQEEPISEKERIEIVITEIMKPVSIAEEEKLIELSSDEDELVDDDELEDEELAEDAVAIEDEQVDEDELEDEELAEDAVAIEDEQVDEEEEEQVEEEEEQVDEEEEQVDEEEEEQVDEEEEEQVVEEEEVVEEEDEVVEEEVVEEEGVVEEEEEGGVFEIEINGETYYTDNDQSGDIYNTDDNGDPYEIVGTFVEGVPVWA